MKQDTLISFTLANAYQIIIRKAEHGFLLLFLLLMMNYYALLMISLMTSFLFLSGCGKPSSPTPPLSQGPSSAVENTCIGVQCRTQPTTPEDFMPVFAQQIKQYASLAPTLRPDNAVKDFVAIVVNMERTKARKVQPDGTYTSITIAEADTYGKTVGYDTEFIYFSKEGEKGIVLTLNEARLKNPSSFERYAHLGTYDLFITYVHELFHKEEQSKRNTPTNLADKERNELLDAYEARAARAVIIQQLLSAFSSPQTELAYLKKAVATYRAYEKAFPQDATITHQWDTLEGSAYYFELISSLKVGYPTIQTIDDVYYVYGKIAPTVKVIDWVGAVNEGYLLGGIAGILLDHIGQTGRKEETMKTSTSAMEFLARYLEKETTPQDVVVVSTQMKDEYARLADKGKELTPEQIENILNMFKQYKQQDVAIYNLLLEQLQTENPALFEKIKPLLD